MDRSPEGGVEGLGCGGRDARLAGGLPTLLQHAILQCLHRSRDELWSELRRAGRKYGPQQASARDTIRGGYTLFGTTTCSHGSHRHRVSGRIRMVSHDLPASEEATVPRML